MSFNKLSNEDQRTFARLCSERKAAYIYWTRIGKVPEGKDILIVGDRPGPKAHQGDDHHHTPFYSKLYSGGWLNAQLTLAGISERRLMWVNSATWDGKPTDPAILTAVEWKHIVALGNNASKWLTKNECQHWKADHPQAHKRFKSSEPYPLIDFLKQVL